MYMYVFLINNNLHVLRIKVFKVSVGFFPTDSSYENAIHPFLSTAIYFKKKWCLTGQRFFLL